MFDAKRMTSKPAIWGSILAIMAIGLFVASQPFMARLWSTLFLFWHYVFVAVLMALLGLTLALRRSRAFFAIVAALWCLVFAMPWMRDLSMNMAVTGSVKAASLKVIAFNWRYGNPQVETIYTWLAHEQPDIASVEEFYPSSSGGSQRLYQLFPYHSEVDAGNDVVILSKYPISKQYDQRIYDRTFSRLIIAAPGGDVLVYAVHPETVHTGIELTLRNAYLTMLGDTIDTSEPRVLVLGDFNATRWDPFVGKILSKGHLHEQPWLFPPITRILASGSIVSPIGSPIDHIMTNTGNRLSSCHVGPAMGSDHVPLECQVNFH